MIHDFSFTQFLRDKHAEGYNGTDDGMPDAFDAWFVELPVDTLIAYVEEWHKAKK